MNVDTKLLIELFGYLGSALVVVSMLMSSVVRLRVINTIGSVIFAIYALIIHSYPTALMNFFLVGINIYQLSRITNKDANYSILELERGNGYLDYLLSYYKEDIAKYFPSFPDRADDYRRAFAVCCDNVVAGLMLGTEMDGGFDVLLDYSTPEYRDCSVGKYLYDELPKFGVDRLRYEGNQPDHVKYLEKMGFHRTEDGSYYIKSL